MDDQLIEELSDAVHQGWMAEKQRQGFADHVLRPQGRWGMVYRPLPCCLLPRSCRRESRALRATTTRHRQ